MLLGPVRTHLTTWAGNSDCIAKINSRGEMRAGAGLGKLGGWCRLVLAGGNGEMELIIAAAAHCHCPSHAD